VAILKKRKPNPTPIRTATQIAAVRPGVHNVTNATGLYLRKNETGGGTLFFRYRFGGKQREMGLGSVAVDGRDGMTLAQARDKAHESRQMVRAGVDPIAARNAAKTRAAEDALKITFEQAVEKYLALHAKKWKHLYARQSWVNPVAKYAYPVLRHMLLDDVDSAHVTQVTDAAADVPGTAKRVRQRIARVLEFARHRGFRDKNAHNPAKDLERIDAPTSNYRAVDLDDAPAVLRQLRKGASDSAALAAWVFMIATAVRPKEALLAKWAEVDFEKKVWTVPAARMKGKIGKTGAHVVPLSTLALEVLERRKAIRTGDAVFPGPSGSPMSYDRFATAARRMGVDAGTPHSWRSINRRWAAAIGHVPYDIAEAILGHKPPPTVRAYLRDVPAEARRPAMEAYAQWLMGAGADVIAFPARA
jgi:integrase